MIIWNWPKTENAFINILSTFSVQFDQFGWIWRICCNYLILENKTNDHKQFKNRFYALISWFTCTYLILASFVCQNVLGCKVGILDNAFANIKHKMIRIVWIFVNGCRAYILRFIYIQVDRKASTPLLSLRAKKKFIRIKRTNNWLMNPNRCIFFNAHLVGGCAQAKLSICSFIQIV